MKWFRSLYVWAMNAKLFMALYFIVLVFAMAVVTLLTGGDSIKLLTLLEMLMTCAVVGFLQAFLLNDSADYSRGVLFGRSILWLLLSGAAVLGAALLFGWLAGSSAWALAAFTLFFMLTLMFALMGLKFEQDADTRRLNSDLKRFQARE